MNFVSRHIEEIIAPEYATQYIDSAGQGSSEFYEATSTFTPTEMNDDANHFYDDYLPTTVDPDWWFTVYIIMGCFCLNLTLPIWIYFGNRFGFHDRSHRENNNKSSLSKSSKNIGVESSRTINQKPNVNTNDNANINQSGENTSTLLKQLGEARSMISGFSYAPGEEVGSHAPPGSVVSGSIAVSRAGTHLGFHHLPHSFLINDDTASMFSGTSGFMDAVLGGRPKRVPHARRRAAKTKRIASSKSCVMGRGENSEHGRDHDIGFKKRLDVRMAAEFTKAEMDLLEVCNEQQEADNNYEHLTPKTSASEADFGDIDDSRSVAYSIMSKLDADAISVRDAVDARDGERPQVEHDVKLIHYVPPGTTGSHGYFKSVWNRLMVVADWDKEMKKYLSLAAHYSAQGILDAVLSAVEFAFISHLMGVPQATAYIMASTISGVTGTIAIGFYECVGVLIPQAKGNKNNTLVGRYMQLGVIFYMITMLPGAIFCSFYTDDFVRWYKFDENIAEMAQKYFLASLPGYVIYGFDAVLWELLNSAGHESYCTGFTIISGVLHTGIIVGMLWWGVKDLFILGAVETASSMICLLINFCVLINRGWLDPYWEGLFKTNGLRDWRAVKNVVNTALPLSLAWTLTYGEWEIMTLYCRAMGDSGAEVAAWGILSTIWSVFETLTDGFGDAAEVRVGFRMGAGQVRLARLATDKSLYVSFVVAVYCTGVLFVLAPYIPGWLTPDPTLQRMIFDIFPLIGFGQILFVWGMVAWAILGAQGRIRVATALEFFISWGIGAPTAAIFVFMFNFNIEGIIGGLTISYSISTTVYLYMLHTSDWEKLSAIVVARNATEGNSYDEFEWDDLSDKIQHAAAELGYNKWIWENDDMQPASDDKDWDELTAAEQKAALLLGYTKKTWDCETDTEDRDDSSNSSSESSNGDSWKQLSNEAKRAAKILGYTQSIWDSDGSPPTEDKDWDELSPKERDAAKTLGYTKSKWNAEDDDESDETPQQRIRSNQKNIIEKTLGSIRDACSYDSDSAC